MIQPPPPPAGQPPKPPAGQPPPPPGWGVVQPGTATATPDRGLGCLLRGLGCLPLLFGIIFLASGAAWYGAVTIPSSWPRTQGTVTTMFVNLPVTTFGGATNTYLAAVRYRVDGRSLMVDTSIQSRTLLAVGDPVTVAYDPANPANARVVDAQPADALWVFVGGGVAATLIGLVLLVVGPLRILAFVVGIFASVDRHVARPPDQ